MSQLSIITINLNNCEGLKRTIESVINQSWKDFEYIIIDGGSTDGSAEYISEMQEHFAYWVSEPDKGIYNAMNKGIKEAKGEYLLFLNSGDYLINNNALKDVFTIGFTEDIIYCDIKFAYQEREVEHVFPENVDVPYFIDGAIGHPSSFIHSKLFKTLGYYDENFKIVSDWKFFLMAKINPKITFRKIKFTLTVFRMDGISNLNKNLGKNERQFILNNDYPYLLKLRKYDKIKVKWDKSNRIQFLLKIGFLKNIFQ
jgi:glycosyltransferase involved in cell wall biosynthesis